MSEKTVEVHPETWVALEDCGLPQPYTKTFGFDGDFINDFHAMLAHAPTGRMGIPVCIDIGIDGYLQRGDALKLYELAYFSNSDVMELGTHKGLSTSIIARALADAGSIGRLETDDIDADANRIAKANLADNPGAARVNFNLEYAVPFMDRLIREGRKFGFIFVDHWHGYDETRNAAIRVHKLLVDGGFVLFHDYNDIESRNPDHPHKVYQAVANTIVKDPRFHFCAVSGCCVLFRKLSWWEGCWRRLSRPRAHPFTTGTTSTTPAAGARASIG